VIATRAGLVRCEEEQHRFSVDGSQKRVTDSSFPGGCDAFLSVRAVFLSLQYIPSQEDFVLGTITEKGGEYYKVPLSLSQRSMAYPRLVPLIPAVLYIG